jgi:DNA-binding XRE family transcriptional regulator
MTACSGVAESDGSALHGDLQMNVQVIERDGQPEYAVLPWSQYQALLQAAGRAPEVAAVAMAVDACKPALSQLTALREAKGMSAEQLARNVGISPHYLGMIESGERQPDAAIQRALAWHLGVDGWEAQP